MPPAVDNTEVRLTLPTGELVLSDGRVVKPQVIEMKRPTAENAVVIENARQAQATLERTHRKLGELPETPERLNAFAAILVYESVGLSVDDIAVALRTSVDNIERVLELDAYKQLREMFDTATFEDTKRAANHIIARAATKATRKIVDFVDSDDPNIALNAARDVSKMAGVGVDRANENKISGLNIKITRAGDKKDDEITVEINNA